MTSGLQARLSFGDAFQPVAAGKQHYVVALQNKKGELEALRRAETSTWSHLTPLVEIVGPKRPGTEPFTKQRVHGWVKRIAEVVENRPWFLDLLRLSANHLVTARDGNRPVLSEIHAAARKRSSSFVPVVHLGELPATLRQVADSAACDGRGVAVRVPLLGTVSADGRSNQTLVKEILHEVEVEVTSSDLLLDLRFLAEDVEVDVDYLQAMIEDLVALGSWRSLVLLGTTMPSSLGGGVVEAGTVGRLSRQEWALWRALSETGISRLPTYGDYAVQHPDPPLDVAEGQIPLGMRGSIRYTHDDVTVIPRAKAPRYEEGKEQYRQLCRSLVAQPEFLGRDFSWGDGQIADCANDLCEPGWEDHWRAAGTSHHLRFVVEQLGRLN